MKSLLVGCAALAAALSYTPANADLLLQYKFDEVSGTNAADTGTGTPAPGTLTGGAVYTTDTPGGISPSALDLSTVAADYVNAGDVNKLDGLSALTISAWVNLRAAPAHGNRIAAKQNTANVTNYDGFSFAFSNPTDGSANRRADNVQLNLALGGTGGFQLALPNANFSADQKWVFVAATYDGAAVNFYTGESASSVSQLGTPFVAALGALVANDNDFRVGASSTATSSAAVWIDDVRVYNSALSATELDAIRLENVTAALLAGDYNADGFVGTGDLNLVLSKWGQNVPANDKLQGDGSGDGFVGTADLNQILSDWGQGAAPAPAEISAMLAAVPEPASLSLLGLAGLGLLGRRRSRA